MSLLYLPPQPSTSAAPQTTYSLRSEDMSKFSLHANFRTPLNETLKELDELLDLLEGWNGYDVAAPNPKAVAHAKLWIERLYDDVLHTPTVWRKPHVTASEDGDVLFEWWNGEKGLSVYISTDGKAEYLKDWGSNIVTQMADGDATAVNMRNDVWPWLSK